MTQNEKVPYAREQVVFCLPLLPEADGAPGQMFHVCAALRLVLAGHVIETHF